MNHLADNMPMTIMLTKSSLNDFSIVFPSGQSTAVKNSFRRFCLSELTAEWRVPNPDSVSGSADNYSCIVGILANQAINSAVALGERIKPEREATARYKDIHKAQAQ